MPVVELNGINLSHEVEGDGGLVVLVMGTGSPGHVWRLHQVPAFVAAGYRVATPDNRGIPPTDECADGMTIDDLAGDTAALIEHLGGGPARVAGTSLGARVTQELALTRPDLVSHATMLGTHGRPDPVRTTLSQGRTGTARCGHHAAGPVLRGSRRDQEPVAEHPSPTRRSRGTGWTCSSSPARRSAPACGHRWRSTTSPTDYARIAVPCLVVGFADDRMLPPHLAREVADAIPDARYAEVADAGHLGYLERPAEVNRLLLEFFAG